MSDKFNTRQLTGVAPPLAEWNKAQPGVRPDKAAIAVTTPAVTPTAAVAAEADALPPPPPPPAQAVPPANEAFSIGVSYGLASYFAHTLVDMADRTQSAGLLGALKKPLPRSHFANMLGETIRTGDRTISTSIARALAEQMLPPPYGLMDPHSPAGTQLIQAQPFRAPSSSTGNPTISPGLSQSGPGSIEPPPLAVQADPSAGSGGVPFDQALFSETSKAGFGAVRNFHAQLVTVRETALSKLRKVDAKASQAMAAGVNIGIAEGFASRGSDEAAIVKQGLEHAHPDVAALGLDVNRLQQAIDFAQPGANMKVLHGMVMSMRISFEAAL